jgi:hypothetical protein
MAKIFWNRSGTTMSPGPAFRYLQAQQAQRGLLSRDRVLRVPESIEYTIQPSLNGWSL